MKVIVWLIGAYDAGDKRHAQEIMRDYGIKYESAQPNPIADNWVFSGVDESTLPDALPSYIDAKGEA